jgi:hypothetical protein
MNITSTRRRNMEKKMLDDLKAQLSDLEQRLDEMRGYL